MMTPQEVANCTFAKSVMGGYNMASVDDFLDRLTEDYSALFKENSALKAKLKVTVDKMAEYRESEDAIRSTLLAAQKMATAMVTEAEQKREAMIEEASREAKARLAELAEQVADEERRLEEVRARVDQELEVERKRLAAGQEKLRSFIRDVTAVCNEQLAALELLPELPVEPPAPPAPVSAPAAEPEEEPAPAHLEEDAAPDEEEAAKVQRNLEKVLSSLIPEAETPEAVPASAVADPFAEEAPADEEEDTEATRVINLDELQFGRNYTKD